jgi:anti-sigma B factor antagonist
MSESEFQASVAKSESGSVIKLVGVVNRSAMEGMEAAFAEATGIPGEIRLDFGDVEYINSTGIAVIVGILATARAENREVGAFGLSDHYREVFQITRLSDFMNIYEDSNQTQGAQ